MTTREKIQLELLELMWEPEMTRNEVQACEIREADFYQAIIEQQKELHNESRTDC